MLTTLLIALLAIALFAYVALPLVLPRGADPLPPERDPVTSDLEEEKAALFRAIKELDLREDLSAERREQLRARYEAKAAKVLRALDERAAKEPVRRAARRKRRRPPYGALALLAVTVLIATSLGAYVLPRVGDASVTAFFEGDLDAGRQLRELRRAAQREPSAENLLALADGYWELGDAAGAEETYLRAIDEANARSPLAYRRLGYLNLQRDLDAALAYLQEARELAPDDLDTLYAIGEIHFARGEFEAAKEAWQAFLETPGGAADPQVTARLELVDRLAPLAERVQENPSEENLLALADALWQAGERQRAVEAYFQVLTQHDPNDPTALGRTGQLMFLSGRTEDAILLMERAARSDEVGAQTLLFLGNAYFSAQRYEEAISAWERHIALVGEEQAGRVPSLIEDARARLSGVTPVAEEPGEADGATVFARNCAGCHGHSGEGGAGPRLAGSGRAADERNVRSAVEFGRGMMPAFGALLSDAELEAVVRYVTETLSQTGE
ncbi:MAG TPA: c-type cytochrome [Trueperaceae bacterium]